MKSAHTPAIVAALALTSLTAFGLFPQAPLVHARAGTTASPPALDDFTYSVLPSETDDGADCDWIGLPAHIPPGIGCDNRWGDLAIDKPHYLYVPPSSPQSGKLLLFLCGSGGSAGFCENVYPVAAGQGYHVIGLTYPAGTPGDCYKDDALTPDQQSDCFGDYVSENVTGFCPPLGGFNPTLTSRPGCDKSTISEHPQDSVVYRLVKVLRWAQEYAADQFGEDHGWGQYFTVTDGAYDVNWKNIHLAGFSNGSSHVSLMGTLYQDIGRVALFAGPNDGDGDTSDTWAPANYIDRIDGVTNTRYYGLVHELNRATSPSDDVLFKVTKNWRTFGMGTPDNAPRFVFDPVPGFPDDFGNAHMLVSTDETDYRDAHTSVVTNEYCTVRDPDDPDKCDTYGDGVIGYEPAWRCILGTGNSFASQSPVASAGPDQTRQCQANGGARVVLDGSRSEDADCDVLRYTWTGPFREARVRNPNIFFPLGTHAVSLVVDDDWSASLPATTNITVVDTRPPTLRVTLTPRSISPANNRLVRINAVVNVADSCGGTPPRVVLSSITSNQPDNGTGAGDTRGDIQGAEIGTFDRSFFVRAERGRTYTVTYTATDASGNQTQKSATVHVPHGRR